MSENNSHLKADLSRGLYSILFLIIMRIISIVIFVMVLAQFIHSLLKGKPYERLLSFSSDLSEYVKEIVSYLGFNTDTKPWPMGNWPSK